MLFLALLAVAGQATTTTDCRSMGWGTISCTSNTSQQMAPLQEPIDYVSRLGSVDPLKAFQQAEAAQASYQQQRRIKRASEMIAAGDCPGAMQYALKHGDLPLAQVVKGICQ